MMHPARTTRPKSIAQQIGNSMSQLSRRIDLDCSAANSEAQWPMMRTEGSFTKAPGVVPRPVAIDFPTRNDANGRNRFCAHALHFDALRDERTGDENRLLSHFFLSLRAALDRRIGKRGAGRD